MHTIMPSIGRMSRLILTCIGCIAGQPALANSANTSSAHGAASAQVASPLQLVAVNALQFGTFAQPQVGGTIVVSPSGTIATTGDLGADIAVAQSTPRGPASFRVTGEPGVLFIISGVSQVTISNGSARMTVGQFTTNIAFALGQVGTTGTVTFTIGGTLTASANQAAGSYSGTFPITVTYY